MNKNKFSHMMKEIAELEAQRHVARRKAEEAVREADICDNILENKINDTLEKAYKEWPEEQEVA